MELLFTPNALMALLTLTFLEIILGIDNIVFLSIVSGKLKAEDQPRARRIGLLLAMLFRIILLFGITWVLSLQDTLFSIDWEFIIYKNYVYIKIILERIQILESGKHFFLLKDTNLDSNKIKNDRYSSFHYNNMNHELLKLTLD
jgi:predicted tellurium resistance membrane protein TerC